MVFLSRAWVVAILLLAASVMVLSEDAKDDDANLVLSADASEEGDPEGLGDEELGDEDLEGLMGARAAKISKDDEGDQGDPDDAEPGEDADDAEPGGDADDAELGEDADDAELGEEQAVEETSGWEAAAFGNTEAFVKNLFETRDDDKDNHLTREEIAAWFKAEPSQVPEGSTPESEVPHMFDFLDTDQDGKISQPEMLKVFGVEAGEL